MPDNIGSPGMAPEIGPSTNPLNTAEAPSYDYATFPRQFISYRWFKPILVGLLIFVFMLIFQMGLIFLAVFIEGDYHFLLDIGLDYDTINPYTAPNALILIGGIGVILPALALSALIVQDRPFSSYSSSRGGWNWSAFIKCLIAALASLGVLTVAQIIFFPEAEASGVVSFTITGAIACLILVPLQCMAEEYLFRGLVMQAIGSWTKLPVLAVIAQAAIFAVSHTYNILGVISIFIHGLIWGFIAWKTKGLEATCAAHIVNNMIGFGAAGLGLAAITSEVTLASLVIAFVADIAYGAIVLIADKRSHWFTSKGDGTAKFNEAKREKLARKLAEQGPQGENYWRG